MIAVPFAAGIAGSPSSVNGARWLLRRCAGEQCRALADLVKVARRYRRPVQQFEQCRSAFETLARNFQRRRQGRDRVERTWLAVHRQRIKPSPEETGRSAAQGQAGAALELAARAVAGRHFGNGDKRRASSSLPSRSFDDHRTHVRKVGPLRRPDVVVLFGPLGRPPRERVVNHRRMVAVGIADRTHEGVLVRHLAQPRKMLADLDAGNVGGDRLKRPADLGRRLGLRSNMSRCGGPPSR